MKNPLLDKKFLKELDQYKHHEIYAKIILLDFHEMPVEEIQGVITQGSINIDGASALRRTCSLTMVTPIGKITSPYWGFKNKIKLEIGLKNFINSNYPDIIWFKQGLYIITGLSESTSNNSHTINITGQDKMCLLNGTIGGNLPSSVDFGQFEEIDINGNSTITKIEIQEIIKNAVHVYGEELLSNIIINDLDTYGLELLEYRGDEEHPLYMLRTLDGTIDQVSFNNFIKEEDYEEQFQYDTLINGEFGHNEPTIVEIEGKNYTVVKIIYGQTVGYRKSDLVYAGDLIANINETLTSVLDKIKNMLGNFEYFYNLDGKFIFQKKQTYENTSWNNIKVDGGEIYLSPSAYTEQYEYEFENSTLISSFNSNPTLNNVKNDYSIWGQRKSASGAQLPIHLRIAIDAKPIYYKNYKATKEYSINDYDWRELIYQMALDYFQYGKEFGFENKIIENNKQYYFTGKTGYEKYYTDLQGFWRQLYDPETSEINEELYILGKYTQVDKNTLNEETEYYIVQYDKLNRQYEIVPYNSEIHLDYNIYKYEIKDKDSNIYTNISLLPIDIQKVYYRIENQRIFNSKLLECYIEQEAGKYILLSDLKNEEKEKIINSDPWNSILKENPENINFWFDFINANDSELSKYAISAIGDRPKVINDTNIKSIIYREIPNVLFLKKEDYDTLTSNQNAYKDLTGYTFINMPENFENYFSISSQGLSAYNKFESLLYQHSYYTESVSITSIPIYYLEPNKRIKVYDEESKINGDYIVNKITIPLQYNGTSSISATKAIRRIL